MALNSRQRRARKFNLAVRLVAKDRNPQMVASQGRVRSTAEKRQLILPAPRGFDVYGKQKPSDASWEGRGIAGKVDKRNPQGMRRVNPEHVSRHSEPAQGPLPTYAVRVFEDTESAKARDVHLTLTPKAQGVSHKDTLRAKARIAKMRKMLEEQ